MVLEGRNADLGRGMIMPKRLTSKINGGLGNALGGPRHYPTSDHHLPGTQAGILIDGVIYPLEGEPPVATTQGWGQVPGTGGVPAR